MAWMSETVHQLTLVGSATWLEEEDRATKRITTRMAATHPHTFRGMTGSATRRFLDSTCRITCWVKKAGGSQARLFFSTSAMAGSRSVLASIEAITRMVKESEG